MDVSKSSSGSDSADYKTGDLLIICLKGLVHPQIALQPVSWTQEPHYSDQIGLNNIKRFI